nr:hypothetical protein [Tanacetum cinerariifolium]
FSVVACCYKRLQGSLSSAFATVQENELNLPKQNTMMETTQILGGYAQ